MHARMNNSLDKHLLGFEIGKNELLDGKGSTAL